MASPAFAADATSPIFPCTVGGPAVQAPTSKRQGLRKNISLFCDFTVGAGLALPAFAVPADPKICPRTVGGPAMQAPTSKGQGFHKNISLFCDSIVGASIARPLRPCAAARLFGWSRAPPLQWAARCGCDYKRYFMISQKGRLRAAPRCGLHSLRGDRSLKTVHCTVF